MTTPIGFVLTLDGERNVTDGMRRVGGSVDSVDGAVGKLRSSLGGLAGAFGAAVGVREFFQAADAVTSLSNKLTLATGSAQAAASAYGQLFDIAQRSRVGFVELGNTFASISTAAADMGVSQGRLLKVTEAIGNAVTISGSSAQAAQAALVQLGQGLASGTLRGEELNSVMEQTPRLAKAIADGMGIARGELRALGAQGAITAEQVIKALESQADVLGKEIGGSVLTVGQAFTQLKNASTLAVGEFDKATGASQMLAGGLSTLAEAVQGLGRTVAEHEDAFKLLGGGLAGVAAVAGIAGLAAGIAKVGGAVTALGAVLAANPVVLALLGFGAVAAGGIGVAAAYSKTEAGMRETIATLQFQNERSAIALKRAEDSNRVAGAENIRREMEKRRDQILKLQAEIDGTAAGSVGGGRGTVNPRTVAALELERRANESEINKYLGENSRQTQAQIREQEIAKARKHNAELMAKAEGDTNTQLRLQAALKTEIANIESRYKDKGAGGASATANAYKELTHSLADKIKLGELELATDGKVSESQKLRARYAVDLTDKLKGLGAAERAVIESQLQTLEAQERKRAIGEGDLKLAQMLAQQRQDEVRGIEAYMQAQEDASRKSLQSVQDRIAGLQDEEQAISTAAAQNVSLAEAVELVAIARLREEQARYNDVEGGRYREIEKEIEARQKLLGVMRGKEVRDANRRASEDAARDWERTAETISSTLQDYIMGGGRNAAEYIKRLFSTLVLQPVVKTLVGGAMGALGFAAPAAAGTSALSAVGTGASILNAGSALGGLGAVGGAIQGFGTAMMASVQSLVGITGTTAQMVASLTAAGHVAAPGMAAGVGAFNAIPGWGWALAGVAALASIFSKKSTPHMGAASSYSASAGLQSNADLYAGLGFTDTRHYDAQVEGITAPLATAIGKALDGIAVTFGQKAGYEVAAAFADDSSKDGAWGNLRIRRAGETVAEWGNTDGDKWAGITLSNGEDGVKEFMARAATTVKTLINDMGLPEWAARFTRAMPDTASMDDITAVLATISAYPAQLLQQFGTSRDALVQQFAQGLATGDATAAGQSVADSLVQSVQNAVYTNAAGQLFDIVNQGIVTPVLDAMANGAALSEALSEATIQGTIDRAKEQAQKLAELYGNEEFRSVLDTLRTTVGSALGGAGGYIQTLPNTLAATQAIDSAAQSAAQAAEDARKKWQDITDSLLSDRFQADIALLRAQGREEEALARERAKAIEGFDAYQIGLYDGTQAILGQVAALERQAEAADLARQKAEELAASIASELPAVLDKYRTPDQRMSAGYDRIAFDLGAAGIGVSAQTLMGASKDQIAQAAMAVYNLGTTSDEARLALIRAASGLADLKDQALDLAQGRTDAAYSALEREVNARRTVVQETIADVRSVFDAVGDAARSLYGEVSSTSAMLGAQGRAFIDQALGNARATGYLPDPKDLQRAIQAATGDLGKQVYATQFEADRDRLLLAGKLSDLESISGDQLTEAEKQLKSLDGILENARLQIDALRGIDTSVLGVDARIATLTDAILAERTARNAVKTGGGGGGGGLGGAGGPLMPGWANWGKGDWVVNQGGSLVADAATGTIYSQGGQNLYRSSLVDAATALIEAGQSMDVYDAIKQSGFTLAQADKVLGQQSGTAEDWAKAMGLPIFHTGTSYVPRTGLALLEQGERVIKASDNRALMASLQGGGVSTARLEAQLDQLLDDNRRQAGEIIRLQGQMAKLMSKWDDEGQPEEREAITA